MAEDQGDSKLIPQTQLDSYQIFLSIQEIRVLIEQKLQVYKQKNDNLLEDRRYKQLICG